MAWDWRFKNDGIPPKKKLGKLAAFFIIGITLIGGGLFLSSAPFEIQAKPEPAPQKKYDYYIILDKETELILMYVPVTVRAGDELITEDNKRYVVIEVIDDVAYASFIERMPPK